MPYGVSNSYRRGMVRTYKRFPRDRALHELAPRTLIRMDVHGYVEHVTITAEKTAEPQLEPTFEAREEPRAKALPPALPVISIPSSPLSPSHNPFSPSEASPASPTPPTSPPPLDLTPPTSKLHKPIFAAHKRKRASSPRPPSPPLDEATDSATNSRVQPIELEEPELKKQKKSVTLSLPNDGDPPRESRPALKQGKLTQMRLDLGTGPVSRTCKDCGMEFVPANPEDEAIHRKFHASAIRKGTTPGSTENGIDLGAGFAHRAGAMPPGSPGFEHGADVPVVGGIDASIATLGKESMPAAKKPAGVILDVLQKELGAVPLGTKELWGPGKRKRTWGKKQEQKKGSAKLHLYCIGDRCVGALVVEPIAQSSPVSTLREKLEFEMERDPSCSTAVVTNSTKHDAEMGVARIWTARDYRRKGIARRLLDYAQLYWLFWERVPKDMIAFSQPSGSGQLLARNWFGKDQGWHVYY